MAASNFEDSRAPEMEISAEDRYQPNKLFGGLAYPASPHQLPSITYLGLCFALLVIPMVPTLFRVFLPQRFDDLAVTRQLIMFAGAAVLLLLVRNGERLPLNSVGIRHVSILEFVVGTITGLLVCLAAALAGLLLVRMGSFAFIHSSKLPNAPVWVTTLTMLRAGIVEEFAFRGYTLERVWTLTGKRWFACLVSLGVFSSYHFYMGTGGFIVALTIGAAMTALYLWKRNLWINMSVHFIFDFVPNVLLASVG